VNVVKEKDGVRIFHLHYATQKVMIHAVIYTQGQALIAYTAIFPSQSAYEL